MEQNYIRQLLLVLEDYLFSLKWYDKEGNEMMLKNIIGFDSIFQIIPKRFHKLLEGEIYTQEELSKAREDGRKEGVVEIIDMVLNSIGNSSWTYNPEVDDRKVVEMLKGELSKLKDNK